MKKGFRGFHFDEVIPGIPFLLFCQITKIKYPPRRFRQLSLLRFSGAATETKLKTKAGERGIENGKSFVGKELRACGPCRQYKAPYSFCNRQIFSNRKKRRLAQTLSKEKFSRRPIVAMFPVCPPQNSPCKGVSFRQTTSGT